MGKSSSNPSDIGKSLGPFSPPRPLPQKPPTTQSQSKTLLLIPTRNDQLSPSFSTSFFSLLAASFSLSETPPQNQTTEQLQNGTPTTPPPLPQYTTPSSSTTRRPPPPRAPNPSPASSSTSHYLCLPCQGRQGQASRVTSLLNELCVAPASKTVTVGVWIDFLKHMIFNGTAKSTVRELIVNMADHLNKPAITEEHVTKGAFSEETFFHFIS